jgi:ABC-type dipeptide/oligopeptide/nickel transport system permease subunit
MEKNEKEFPKAPSDASILRTNSNASQAEGHPSPYLISADGPTSSAQVLGQQVIDSSTFPEYAEPITDASLSPKNLSAEELLKDKKKHPGPMRAAMRQFRRDKRAMISVGFMIFLVLLAIIGPPIYQHIGGIYQSDLQGKIGPEVYHRYDYQELSKVNQGPSAQYLMGTDALGEDLLARLMQGLLISITVALLVEVVDVGLGVTIGVMAGYYGGWIDTFLARFTDLVFAFPGLLFAILLTGIFGQNANDYFSKLPLIGGFLGNGNASLVIVSIALAVVTWPLMARYVRGQTLQLKNEQFIEASRTIGTKDAVIMAKHIVPNLINIVIVTSTMNIANTIIGEATLSLLGLGVVHPGSSLGLMIDDGVNLLDLYPWDTLFPTIVLTLIVLAIAFIGDGLRDAFDPRQSAN